MNDKIKQFAELFNTSPSFIENTLNSLGISADNDNAQSQLAFLLRNDTIEWYCDKCGERLDLQPGFSRSYSTYTCKACKHKNLLDYRFVEWKK